MLLRLTLEILHDPVGLLSLVREDVLERGRFRLPADLYYHRLLHEARVRPGAPDHGIDPGHRNPPLGVSDAGAISLRREAVAKGQRSSWAGGLAGMLYFRRSLDAFLRLKRIGLEVESLVPRIRKRAWHPIRACEE